MKITKEDLLKAMLDWHEKMVKEKRFGIPLDHEQSEYLSWLAYELVNNVLPDLYKKEIERLQGFIKTAFIEGMGYGYEPHTHTQDEAWQQFAKENNL